MMRRAALVGLAAFFALAAAASAQVSPELQSALRAGIVGERFDGYMGLAAARSSRTIRNQVAAINIRRRSLYIDLGSRRNVTPEMAGVAVGCQLLARVGVGEAYMLNDGVWRRRAAGQPAPRPAYCGGA
jgi:uncharacterized protein